MTTPTFNPPVPPSVGITDTPEVKLLTAQFGGGYSQITADGINHIRTVRELEWDMLYREEYDEIIAFLRERGGYQPFLYQLDHDPKPIRFTCEKWSGQAVSGGYFRVTATFRQHFSMAA